jgi:hypothetical protein
VITTQKSQFMNNNNNNNQVLEDSSTIDQIMNAGNYVLRIEECREVKCMRHKLFEMKWCRSIGAIIHKFS